MPKLDVITAPRRTGRTTNMLEAALEWLRGDGIDMLGMVVCANRQHVATTLNRFLDIANLNRVKVIVKDRGRVEIEGRHRRWLQFCTPFEYVLTSRGLGYAGPEMGKPPVAFADHFTIETAIEALLLAVQRAMVERPREAGYLANRIASLTGQI